MSYVTIASMSYQVPEGTYSVELLEDGGTSSSRTLHLLEKPIVRAKSDDLFGILKQDVRIRVRDVNREILTRLQDNAHLRLKISGPKNWEGDLHKVENVKKAKATPRIELRFRDFHSEKMQGTYSLTGNRHLPVLFYDLLQKHGVASSINTSINWTHTGQYSDAARYLRLPSEEISFLKYEDRKDPESHLDILKGLLKFLNCRLTHDNGEWLIRRVSSLESTMDVLEFDGQSYYPSSLGYGFTADDSTILRKINDRTIRARKIDLKGLGRVASRRYRNEQVPFKNEQFTDWTNSDPDHWDANTNAVENPSGWARLSQDKGDFLRQRATETILSDIEIHLEAEVPPTANDGETYDVHFAEVILEDTESGTLYYDGGSQSWQASSSQFSFSFTVDTTAGSGTEPGDLVAHTLSFPPTSPPSDGRPVLHLLFDWTSSGPDLRFVQFDRAIWNTDSPDRYGREHSAGGDGSEDRTFHTFIGDRRTDWLPSGVIHYYDGTRWAPATQDWEGPQLGQNAPPAINVRRIFDQLRQRRNRLYGFRMWVPREKALSPSVVPIIDGVPHVVTGLRVKLGVGAARLDVYPLGHFSAPLNSYNFQNLFAS